MVAADANPKPTVPLQRVRAIVHTSVLPLDLHLRIPDDRVPRIRCRHCAVIQGSQGVIQCLNGFRTHIVARIRVFGRRIQRECGKECLQSGAEQRLATQTDQAYGRRGDIRDDGDIFDQIGQEMAAEESIEQILSGILHEKIDLELQKGGAAGGLAEAVLAARTTVQRVAQARAIGLTDTGTVAVAGAVGEPCADR